MSCHAMGDVQNCCVQPRLTAMQFSYVLTLKGCMYAVDNVLQKGTMVSVTAQGIYYDKCKGKKKVFSCTCHENIWGSGGVAQLIDLD